MDRTYIICHIVTSLDGKVTGDFLERLSDNGGLCLIYQK